MHKQERFLEELAVWVLNILLKKKKKDLFAFMEKAIVDIVRGRVTESYIALQFLFILALRWGGRDGKGLASQAPVGQELNVVLKVLGGEKPRRAVVTWPSNGNQPPRG